MLESLLVCCARVWVVRPAREHSCHALAHGLCIRSSRPFPCRYQQSPCAALAAMQCSAVSARASCAGRLRASCFPIFPPLGLQCSGTPRGVTGAPHCGHVWDEFGVNGTPSACQPRLWLTSTSLGHVLSPIDFAFRAIHSAGPECCQHVARASCAPMPAALAALAATALASPCACR